MKKSDFHFDLPEGLIAQYPMPERSASRLMVLHGPKIEHRQFIDFPNLLNPGDLLVFNNTKVIPARLFGEKSTGGKVELLVERLLGTHEILAQLRVSKSPKPGAQLVMEGGVRLELVGREDDLYHLRALNSEPLLELLEKYGHIPLPPYIQRQDASNDRERYQTVYANKPGAVAAPTAGLHFDQKIMEILAEKGIETAFVTLHVGAGTFQPVRVDDISEHTMHAEFIDVSAEVCAKVAAAKARGNRVIAVGTTSVRCLESAAKAGKLQPFQGDTRIFIYPGYEFQIVDGLLTNFHLPESTLIMLVAAFAGYERTLSAYQAAVKAGYRFFSYGDAMYIESRYNLAHEIQTS